MDNIQTQIMFIIQELRLCPMQRISELRKLRVHHPELWARLLEMDNKAQAMFGITPLGRFKKYWSVERLDNRFAQEEKEEQEKCNVKK